MSTGLECEFIEYEPDRWYYILERWDSPKGGGDWHHYANAYGPFPTEEEADQHLRDHHANPGGSYTLSYEESPAERQDPVMVGLVAEATR